MKRIGLAIAIACLAAGIASAQNWSNGWGTTSQTISVNGTLQLQNGVIVVVSGNNAYYVPALTQYIGFLEGLREGAQVSIEGFASGNYVQPTRVTLSGRSYDFTANAQQGFAHCGNGWFNAGGSYNRNASGYRGAGYGCRW